MKVYWVKGSNLFHKLSCAELNGCAKLFSADKSEALFMNMKPCPKCFGNSTDSTHKYPGKVNKSIPYSQLTTEEKISWISKKYPDYYDEVVNDYDALKNIGPDKFTDDCYVDYLISQGWTGIEEEYYKCLSLYFGLFQKHFRYTYSEINQMVDRKLRASASLNSEKNSIKRSSNLSSVSSEKPVVANTSDIAMKDSKEKVTQLLKYLKEFSISGQKIKTNIKDEQIVTYLSDIPQYENYVIVNSRDSSDEENSDDSDVLVEVYRPEHFIFENKPDELIAPWIKYDWQHNYKLETTHEEELEVETNSDVQKIKFEDDAKRVFAFNQWKQDRDSWLDDQKKIQEVDDFFDALYRLYTQLNVDSETVEFVCGNGFVSSPKVKELNYPILTKRVEITYDADHNSVCIRDSEASSKINSMVLNKVDPNKHLFSAEGIAKIAGENEEKDYHPLDPTGTAKFLQKAAGKLNPKSKFLQEDEFLSDAALNFSETEIVLKLNPVFYVRKKTNGIPRAIDAIVNNIEVTGYIPETMLDIIGQNKVEEEEKSVELDDIQVLAEAGGEDPDILLPLPANREQLEIARRIEKYNGVVVQGPPGTGKTHTIANLIGHFLSEGKSVLVTSSTKKALTVLKDKVPKSLQNLCVSLLDDNHEDMERSVNGIMDYQSTHNEYSIKRKADESESKRNDIIAKLADVRKRILDIKNSEFKPIVYNGENYSLSQMGRFIHDNQDLKDIIPGTVDKDAAFPLTPVELVDLYASNDKISKDDEINSSAGLPNPDELIQPSNFFNNIKCADNYFESAEKTAESIGYNLQENGEEFLLIKNSRVVHLHAPKENSLDNLNQNLSNVRRISEWQKKAILAGKSGDAYRKTWEDLVDEIQKTLDISEASYELLMSHEVKIEEDTNELRTAAKEVKDIYDHDGKIGKISRFAHKKALRLVEEKVKVNGETVKNAQDCEAVIQYIDLTEKRKNTAILWNKLIASEDGEPSFYELSEEPERIAAKYIPDIQTYLNWYENDYSALLASMEPCGIDPEEVFEYDHHLPDKEILEIILDNINKLLLPLLKVQKMLLQYHQQMIIYEQRRKVLTGITSNSKLFYQLKSEYDSKNTSGYETKFNEIANVYNKSNLIAERNKSIEKIKAVAPQWAVAIQNRIGVHARQTAPDRIRDAWKWKQFDAIIKYYDSNSFEELQHQSVELSEQYRQATEQLCKYKAWAHLLGRIESNKEIKQDLFGWAETVKQIGSGHGKKAPYFKKKARELMAQCQNAVPVWIMTTSQVFDNMNPGENQFDVVIVDESSKSDITAIALLYYGKKAVIVGDDKQVSPLNIGDNIDAVTDFNKINLENSGIPNSHLYTTMTSLYKIATTSFKSLMLHEHFRCVPAIIGFSNMLSYDYKIMPLRDQSSSNLLPPLVAYNANGERDSQGRNILEAKTIIALLKAFLSIPEYQDKTFGVISLLGTGRQVQYLQQNIDIPPAEMEKHKIQIGIPSQFQGDERDVIILSMVDSNTDGEGPLSLHGNGYDDRDKKRYNVAVSRAKDQVWVIHSLDMHRDLKPNDLRRRLLEYVSNPQQFLQSQEANVKSESPFELEVARYLNDHGYKIKQQWPAGGYRIDMVAIDDNTNKKIAIECDGEAYHSSEEDIRRDMERQTILERVGWTFIRIRGSEYFKDPEATMKRVMDLLTDYDIHPYSSLTDAASDESELKQRVIDKMQQILQEEKNKDPDIISDRKRSVENFIAGTNRRKNNNAAASVKKVNESKTVKAKGNNVNLHFPKPVQQKKISIQDHNPKEIREPIEKPEISASDHLFLDELKEAGISFLSNDKETVIVYDRKKANALKSICKKYGISPVYRSPAKANNKTGSWIIRKK